MKTILDFDLKNKTVILRADLNVTIKDTIIIDDTRILASLKTINYILESGAKLVILSHLGKVKSLEDKDKYSLLPVYERLEELLPGKIKFVPFTRDSSIKDEIDALEYGKAILLENTRFEDLDGKKESSCDEELSKYWASLGDIFINDAFGSIHRAHASNCGISKYIPSGIGFLIMKEIEELSKLDNPKKPFALIMGGAKVSDKIKVISSLINKVDYLFIGGAMANTFLKAKGYDIGFSKYEEEYIDYCKDLLSKYENKIVLPKDFYGSYEISDDTKRIYFDILNVPNNIIALDIGPETVKLFKEKLKGCNTLFWNGPLGAYEYENYKEGTTQVLEYVSNNIETTILGGGDIVGCAKNFGYEDKLTYLSTGGGASLSYLVDKNMPGLINIK